MKWVAFIGLLGLTGCNDFGATGKPETSVECFSIIPSNSNPPYSHVMLDECSGKSWLLVRSKFSDKPEDGYTYQWLSLEKFDNINPHLVSN